ncbi:hypothetical protein [Rhodococcoides fascians]|uniref:hypothetical protein n=1 Tax=Rhodococcoides fascians TaxID=1828 RepID=UPI00366ADA3C
MTPPAFHAGRTLNCQALLGSTLAQGRGDPEGGGPVIEQVRGGAIHGDQYILVGQL